MLKFSDCSEDFTSILRVLSISVERFTDAIIAVFELGRRLGNKLFRTAPEGLVIFLASKLIDE